MKIPPSSPPNFGPPKHKTLQLLPRGYGTELIPNRSGLSCWTPSDMPGPVLWVRATSAGTLCTFGLAAPALCWNEKMQRRSPPPPLSTLALC